jgi:hypothetical protein
VRQGARHVFGQVQEQATAQGGIELVHADADSEHRNLPSQEAADEKAVVFFSAFGHGLNRGMGGLSLAARVHVESAGEHEAIDTVEKGVDFGFFAELGHDYGQALGGQDGIKIAGVEPKLGAANLAGWNEVGVDADPRPRVMGHHFPSLEFVRHYAALAIVGEASLASRPIGWCQASGV